MIRQLLRIIVWILFAIDLLFVASAVALVIDPPAGQNLAGGVGAAVFFCLIAVGLFLIDRKVLKPWQPKSARQPHPPAPAPVVPAPSPLTPLLPGEQEVPPAPATPDISSPASDVPAAPKGIVDATRSATQLAHTLLTGLEKKRAASSQLRRGHMRGREWVPPLPGPDALEPWGRCNDPIEVVGENYRKGVFSKIMGREPGFRTAEGVAITDPATLVFDGANPFSKSHLAIAVYVRGAHVGYVPDDLTRVWGVVLRDLASEGLDLRVRARTWAKAGAYGEVAAVTVYMPDADALRPSNGLPNDPHVIIPVGKKRQVSGEENHMDALAPFIMPGGTNHVCVVLRSVTEIRPRSTAELVQVELNGKRVGRLTDLQSKNLLPLVKYIEARGKLPAARADIVGTALKADVIVMSASASEVSHDWLDALGPEMDSPTEVIPGPDWDWDDEPEAPDEAVLRVRRERERLDRGQDGDRDSQE